MKLFHIILPWQTHTLKQSTNPTEPTISRVNPGIDYELE